MHSGIQAGTEYVLGDEDVIITHTDLQSRITYANEAFVRSSGYSREECMGQPQNLVRHPDMPKLAFRDLWRTIKAGRSWTGIVKNRRKNGGFYWVRANVSPIVAGGRRIGYLSVRVKPTAAEIDAAAALYANINAGRSPRPAPRGRRGDRPQPDGPAAHGAVDADRRGDPRGLRRLSHWPSAGCRWPSRRRAGRRARWASPAPPRRWASPCSRAPATASPSGNCARRRWPSSRATCAPASRVSPTPRCSSWRAGSTR